MLLRQKNAVIYGAGGSIGGAVASALAAAGARVFLTGRNAGPLERLSEKIRLTGAEAVSAVVDALEEQAINRHLEGVVRDFGSVDISFNATGTRVVQNIPLTDISTEDFIGPSDHMLRSRFMTAKAAARHMMKQRSGVILHLTATPGGIGYPYTGGFAPACAAIESFSSNLASELGPYGVRVVNIRSGGSPDSRVFMEAIENLPEEMHVILKKMEGDTMLKKLPLMADIAHLAVFLSSELAGMITGVTVDISSGTTAGLNYKVPSVS